MTHQLTDEQAAIRDMVRDGTPGLVVQAGAGAGKTSTLRACAEALPHKRGVFVAYNREVKRDAAASFPSNVRCLTSHGLAFGEMVETYRHRLNSTTRVTGRDAAEILGIVEPVRLDDKHVLSPEQLARIAVATVEQFAYSADDHVFRHHVPLTPGYEAPELHAAIQEVIGPFARRAWNDIRNPDGRLRFVPDHYLKMWQLKRVKIRKDLLMVDEGQDLNPCFRAVVENQTHMQVVIVGDQCQAIYGWRGAQDALPHFVDRGWPELTLSQSFRFGQPIADEANTWLRLLGARLRLSGSPWLESRLAPVDDPRAILTRSNSSALGHVVSLVKAGVATAIAGERGPAELYALARAAQALKAGEPCEHPDLHAFGSWADVQDYVTVDPLAGDLRTLVSLVDEHTPEGLIRTLDALVPESQARTVVSTAHRGKGREWSTVVIADDFREPTVDEVTGIRAPLRREEAMLIYVALTRAREVLDCRTVSWGHEGGVWVEPRKPVGKAHPQRAIMPDPAVADEPAWLATLGSDYKRDPAERIAAVAAAAPEYVRAAPTRPEPAAEGEVPPRVVCADLIEELAELAALDEPGDLPPLSAPTPQRRWPAPLPVGAVPPWMSPAEAKAVTHA